MIASEFEVPKSEEAATLGVPVAGTASGPTLGDMSFAVPEPFVAVVRTRTRVFTRSGVGTSVDALALLMSVQVMPSVLLCH